MNREEGQDMQKNVEKNYGGQPVDLGVGEKLEELMIVSLGLMR